MATTLVSLGEYLRSVYEPDAEYLDGQIEVRPMGEFDHADWQQAIISFLLANKSWNIRALPDLRVRISESRYRVPDVTVLDRARPSSRSSPTRRSPSLRSSAPRTVCSA